MKKLITIVLLVNLMVANCMVGTKEQACKYYVERDYGGASCDILLLGLTIGENELQESQVITRNLVLARCLTYLSKIESCEKEENKYQPGLYGMFILEKDLEIKINPEKLNLVRRVES